MVKVSYSFFPGLEKGSISLACEGLFSIGVRHHRVACLTDSDQKFAHSGDPGIGA